MKGKVAGSYIPLNRHIFICNSEDKYTLKEAHAMVREHKVQEGKRVSNDIIYIYIYISQLVYH